MVKKDIVIERIDIELHLCLKKLVELQLELDKVKLKSKKVV
jgi:hypothetical protein